MFRHAPKWSPASKVEIPALRLVPKKISLVKKTPPWKRPAPKVHWKKSLFLAELQVVDKQLFPDAPWKVAQKMKLRRFRFVRKSSHSQASSQSKKSCQSLSQGKTQQSH